MARHVTAHSYFTWTRPVWDLAPCSAVGL